MQRSSTALSVATALLALALVHPLQAGPFDGWARQLTFTYTNYAGATPLTNFPVLVKLSTGIEGFRYEDFAAPAAGDLRFAAGVSSNELAYEIDGWDTNGTSCVWVRVPVFTNSTTLHAYWGKSGAEAPASTTNGATWDDTFRAVWHLGAELTSTQVTDSTANTVDGVNYGTTHAAGVIAGARDFESALRNYVDMAATPSSNFLPAANGPITLSCWIRPESIGGSQTAGRVVNIHRGVGGSALAVGVGQNNRVNVYKPDGAVLASLSTVTPGVWSHVAVTFDGTVFRLYLDGVFDNSHTRSLDVGGATTVKLGSFNGASYFYDGVLDETRVAKVARPADWIRAGWLNQASNGTFAAHGYVRELDHDPDLPFIRTLPVSDVMTESARLHGDLVSTGAAPATLTVYWGPEDGGTQANAWAESHVLPATQPAGAVETNLTGFVPGTRYHYRYHAANIHGEHWARLAATFITDGPPLVDNSGGTPGVGYALLNGSVLTNGSETFATVYWGRSDEGTNAAAWGHTNVLTEPVDGAFFADTRPLIAWENGLSGRDINNPGQAGSASQTGGVWTVSGSGADIWGTADQLHFASRPAHGDFDVYCRMGSFSGGNNIHRKAGIMLRQSLTGGSRHVSVLRTPTNGSQRMLLSRREQDGGTTASEGPSNMTNAFYWVRLVREGNLHTGYWAEDSGGVPGMWTPLGSVTVVMDSKAHLGLAVSAHDNTQLTAVNFDGLSGEVHRDGELVYGLPYYYRCFATNGYGTRWAATTEIFVTAPPPGIGIANDTPSDVTADAVQCNGWLDATGSVFDVSLLWGAADGGADPAAWANTNTIGSYSNLNGASLSGVVSNLPQGTWYGTFLASNVATNMVAVPSEAFQPLGSPVISNLAPANVTESSAMLNGYLASGGAGQAAVYWGLTDGQETANAWESTKDVGQVVARRAISAAATGLLANGAYYARWYVTNAVETDWADTSVVFTTAQPTASIGSIAVREGHDGSAVARFPVTLTTASALPVSIDFATSNGTAEAGSEYVATNGTLTIPPGQAGSSIDVRLVGDRQAETLYREFFVNIGNPVNCALANTQVSAEIEDDDPNPLVSAWAYRMKITLRGYAGETTLTNFPVLVQLDGSTLGSVYTRFASAGGEDLRFTDGDGTQVLSHDIEHWDRTGTSCVWVRVPELSGNRTTLLAYWGNGAAAALSAPASGATWDEAFLGVYHLHADADDSTTNANHGLDQNGPLRQPGIAGNGIDVSGGAHVNLLGGARWERLDTNHVDRFTLSAWVNPDTRGIDQTVFGRFGGHSLVWLDAGGGLANYVVYHVGGDQRTSESDGAAAATNTWQHVVATGDGVTLRIYVDGQLGSAAGGDYQYTPSTVPISLGTAAGGSVARALDGSLDEARIAAVARSADWIMAEYANVADHGNFMTYGAVELLRPGILLLVR